MSSTPSTQETFDPCELQHADDIRLLPRIKTGNSMAVSTSQSLVEHTPAAAAEDQRTYSSATGTTSASSAAPQLPRRSPTSPTATHTSAGNASSESSGPRPNPKDPGISGWVAFLRSPAAALGGACLLGAGTSYSGLDVTEAQAQPATGWALAVYIIGAVITLMWQGVAWISANDANAPLAGVVQSAVGSYVVTALGSISLAFGTMLLALSISFHEIWAVSNAGYLLMATVGFGILATVVYLAVLLARTRRR